MKTRRHQSHNKNKKRKKGGTQKRHIFTSEHYQSREGFLTSIWGPALWHFLHTMSFNYPPEPTTDQKKQYMNFILSLEHVLPCKYCRINLEKNFKALPLTMKTMENRDTFSRYVYNLHELINKMLHKKSNLTYEDVRDRYEHFRARGCSKDDKSDSKGTDKDDKSDSKGTDKADADKGGNENQKMVPNMMSKTKKEKEKGCVKPMHGTKAKCVIKIVPQNKKCDTFQMDKSVSKE